MKIENNTLLISIDSVLEEKMLILRGEKVLLDSDLANLFQITIAELQKKVRSQIDRFPEEFMFKIKVEELRKITPLKLKGRRTIYVFTWGGIMMAAGQIRTNRGNEISIQLIRHFSKRIDFDLLQKILES